MNLLSVGLPATMLRTGLELKEKSRFKTVMLSGYGNGDVGIRLHTRSIQEPRV